jgi:hypothetical protein
LYYCSYNWLLFKGMFCSYLHKCSSSSHGGICLEEISDILKTVILPPILNNQGPEGKWRCSSTLSWTSALDHSGWSMRHFGYFTSENNLVTIV